MNKASSNIRALVLSGYGLNCDHETAYAFEVAGATAERVHINSLIDGSVSLGDFRILAFVGGFGWGDDHGAGVIQAVRMKTNIGERILEFIQRDNLVIGICNGFQTLVNIGLLPGLEGNYQKRSVALTYNDCGNFRDDWVCLSINQASSCVFTRGMDLCELPIRHGEGKFVADDVILKQLLESNQIVARYAFSDGNPAAGKFPENPNGSADDIAGICDSTGRIFGLMPHPEAYNHWSNHPDWARNRIILKRQGLSLASEDTPGIRMLKNAVSYLAN